jgi:hypothetical protein
MASITLESNSVENIGTTIDEVGLKYGLIRYKDESLFDFRERVLEVYKRKANTSHKGLQYGVSRELGARTTSAARLRVTRDIAGNPIFPSPGIQVSRTKIIFYSDFVNGTVDQEFVLIDEFPKDSHESAFYLKEIFDYVSASAGFEFDELPDSDNYWLPADHLVPASSLVTQSSRLRITAGMTRLPNDNIIAETFMSSNELFTTEVADIDSVSSLGDYFINYQDGIIYTAQDVSNTNALISYSYFVDPFILEWSPVRVTSLSDEEFFLSQFEQELDEDNSSYFGARLSPELVKLMVEAYRADGTFWFAEDANDTPIDVLETYQAADVITDAQNRFYLSGTNIRRLLRNGR